MKIETKKWWMIGVAFLIVSLFTPQAGKAQGNISLQVFYDDLQPYGTWMLHNTYGYVWIPQVEGNFTPYATNGYWINTQYGNTWVSDYVWGWAPFHYGRWFYDAGYGWLWIPDTEWGPAWVAWRTGGGYYGWAPLMPGLGINVSVNYYNSIPHRYWNFVPYRYITNRSVARHCVPRFQVVNIIHHTTVITHHQTDSRRHVYFTGPARRDMERNIHSRVTVYKVHDRNNPGRSDITRGSVHIYKPEVDNRGSARSKAAPSRFMRENRKGKLEEVNARRDKPNQRSTDQWRRDPSGRQNMNRDPGAKDLNRSDQNQKIQKGNKDRSSEIIEQQRRAHDRNSQERTGPVQRKTPIERNGNDPKHRNEQLKERRRSVPSPQTQQRIEQRKKIQGENQTQQNNSLRREQMNRKGSIPSHPPHRMQRREDNNSSPRRNKRSPDTDGGSQR